MRSEVNLGRKQHQRHTVSRMRASTDKIQIMIARMFVVWSEISHLQDAVANASKDRTLGDVQHVFPSFGQIADFEFDVFLQIGQSFCLEAFQDAGSRRFFKRSPILVLFRVEGAPQGQ